MMVCRCMQSCQYCVITMVYLFSMITLMYLQCYIDFKHFDLNVFLYAFFCVMHIVMNIYYHEI